MPPARLARSYRDRLDSLLLRADRVAPPPDAEFIAHWTRYLCVLVSGLIEVSVREAFLEYCRSRSDERVMAYVDQQLRWFQNPKMSRIIELATSFDRLWADDLAQRTAGELRDAVDSVVANRNQIAHGQNVGLSMSQLKEYYERVCRVLDLVDAQTGVGP